LEDPGVDGKIKLKWIYRSEIGRHGLVTATGGGLL